METKIQRDDRGIERQTIQKRRILAWRLIRVNSWIVRIGNITDDPRNHTN
jgi:hypothetical protein